MPDSPANDVTGLLIDLSKGDRSAIEALLPLVYAELRRLASSYMRREREGHTLGATGLVHEAYLRLVDQNRVEWRDRAHFFGVSANLMRQILVDHARSRQAGKRGGGVEKVAFHPELDAASSRPAEVVAVDEALEELAKLDPDKARLVELRFFGGLSIEETAAVMGISVPTVNRHWRLAKTWLFGRLKAV